VKYRETRNADAPRYAQAMLNFGKLKPIKKFITINKLNGYLNLLFTTWSFISIYSKIYN